MRNIFLFLVYITSSSFINGSVVIILFILLLIFLAAYKNNSNTLTNEDDEWKKREKQKGINERAALLEYEKSEYYARRNELDSVLLHLTNAININPIGKYYGSRGIYKNSKKDYDGAIEDLNKAISLLPDSKLYWYCRAKFYFEMGNLENAYVNWKKAEELGSVGAKDALETYFKDYNSNKNNQENEKASVLNLNELRTRWITYNQTLILSNDTVLQLLDVNPIESINYSMLLCCFEWKYKRFKILVRDNFECQDCNEKSNDLHVHHNYYLQDSMPWEIEDVALVSLCKTCHTKRHENASIKVYKKQNGQLIVSGYHYLNCQRCNGSGYLPEFKHVDNGICFLCFGNVLNRTIFSERLKVIKFNNNNNNYINTLKESLNNFMSSITVEYFSAQINKKIYNESDIVEDDLPF